MAGQAGSGASAEIHPDIKAVRLYRGSQHFFAVNYKFRNLKQNGIVQLVEFCSVFVRSYKQMAVVIGKFIEHRKAVCRPSDYEIFLVLLGVIDIMTDEAFLFFTKVLHISDAPRRPKIFHTQLLRQSKKIILQASL
jgi:hypothetical protein